MQPETRRCDGYWCSGPGAIAINGDDTNPREQMAVSGQKKQLSVGVAKLSRAIPQQGILYAMGAKHPYN